MTILLFEELVDHAFSEMVLTIMFSIVVVVDPMDDGKAILARFSPSQFGMQFLGLKLSIQTLFLEKKVEQGRSFVRKLNVS
jgi:hypothetical protein